MAHNHDPCPENITVSSLEDVLDGPFILCVGTIDNLIITNAVDDQLDLTWRNFTSGAGFANILNILIQDNSGLEDIELPTFDSTRLGYPETGRVDIAGNPALRYIDCSTLSQNTKKNFTVSDFSHGTLNFSNHVGADQIYLYNNPEAKPALQITDLKELNYLKSVGTLFGTVNVPYIHTLEVEVPDMFGWNFTGLKRVDTVIWTNVSIGLFAGDQYEVLEDMVVGPSIFDEPPPIFDSPDSRGSDHPDWIVSSMRFNGVTSIGRNLNITENTFITIEFSDLNKIAGGLNIEGNVNCTLNFNSTTKIGSLYAVNNTNTALPGWFPELEEADDIYLSGYIDTSGGSSIFPNLKIVHNSIHLEPWNSDFNCTHFLAQANSLGFGGTPYCNNTADDAFTAAIPPTSSTTVSDNPSSQTTSSISSLVSTSASILTSTFVSTSTSVLISPSVSTSPPVSTSSSPPPSSSPPNSSTGALSQGAWAGIGVAIAVVVIGGGVLAYLLVRLATYKKKLRRQQQHEGEAGRDENGRTLDDLGQKEMPAREYVRYEADGAQIVEVANRELACQPGELGSNAVPMEMGTPGLLVELP
ncbi:hypothetical protein E8E14_006643 [Neopestalotiopsis sp. 37M]|nr:hypothetical protein E8E14_006643 [Neopestalotiopsis sp. 37M]